jgi:hypothetical protein
MSPATHHPRCSACLANSWRHRSANSLATIYLSLAITTMLLAPASMPAHAEESQNHFVGPPSRLQPRLSNEMGTPRASLVKPVVLVNPVAPVTPTIADGPSRLNERYLPQPFPLVAELQLIDPPLAYQNVVPEPIPPVTEGETIEPMSCYVARPMSSISVNIGLPEGELPVNMAHECLTEGTIVGDSRLEFGWAQYDFHWAATGMWHRPLYFEEINAERYGYTASYVFQPFISAGRFFFTIPALPYKMAVDRPHECQYTLGQYRPGSCVPWRWNHLPLDVTATVVEVGTIAGLILLIP